MASSEVVELKILVPKRIYEMIVKASEKSGITIDDIVLRAIVKVVEEVA